MTLTLTLTLAMALALAADTNCCGEIVARRIVVLKISSLCNSVSSLCYSV